MPRAQRAMSASAKLRPLKDSAGTPVNKQKWAFGPVPRKISYSLSSLCSSVVSAKFH